MNKYIYILIITLGIFTLSCLKTADDVKDPGFKQKIVVSSFLSTDESVSQVQIISNLPIYGELNDDIRIGTANAYLSDGNKEITLNKDETGFTFSHEDMPLTPGKLYRLKIIADNGIKAEASCTIPFKHDFKLHFDTLRNLITNEWGYAHQSLSVSLDFIDFKNETNYYLVEGKLKTYIKDMNNLPYLYLDELSLKNNLFTDIEKDGKNIKAVFDAVNSYQNSDSTVITLYLFNINRDFYQYQLSIKNLDENDNPFSEASPIFSNVTDGLGIFAGYTKDSISIKIDKF